MQQSSETKPLNAGRDRRAVMVFFTLAAIMLVIDLVVKHYAFMYVAGQPVMVNAQTVNNPSVIPPHDPVTLVQGVLSLKLTLNHGAVFGLGQGGRFVFIGVTFIALVVIIMMFWRSPRTQRWLHVGLGLILSGALGNLYDRLMHGAVRDMLYLFPGVRLPFGWSWPGGTTEVYPWIFNVADVCLVIGVGMLFITLLRNPARLAEEHGH